jgi:hypothetical protein
LEPSTGDKRVCEGIVRRLARSNAMPDRLILGTSQDLFASQLCAHRCPQGVHLARRAAARVPQRRGKTLLLRLPNPEIWRWDACSLFAHESGVTYVPAHFCCCSHRDDNRLCGLGGGAISGSEAYTRRVYGSVTRSRERPIAVEQFSRLNSRVARRPVFGTANSGGGTGLRRD